MERASKEIESSRIAKRRRNGRDPEITFIAVDLATTSAAGVQQAMIERYEHYKCAR